MQRFISSFCLLFVFLSISGAARALQLENIRIWAAPDNTRVVFDLSAPTQHEQETLSNPARLVIDLENMRPPARLPQPAAGDRFLRRIRSGRHDSSLRVVLDLKDNAGSRSFLLSPNKRYGHRLVIDLFGAGNAATTKAPPVRQPQPTPAGLRDIVVAVDAGHGGEDPGAIGPGGTYEKTVVLQIAKRLAALLNDTPGMRAILIREADYYLPLRKRINLARKGQADLFVSIHADAFRSSKVRGSSVYVLSRRGASSEHARWLAEQENASDLIGGVSLHDKDDHLRATLVDLSQRGSLEASIDAAERVLGNLKKVNRLHKPGVESAGFAVLKSPDIPSMLVETAFISNPGEEQKLRSAAYQQKLARAIHTGITHYFERNAPANTLLATQRRHTIARGDTLSEIASRYRVSLRSLRDLNGLSDNRIRVGQALLIPAANDG